MPPGHQINYVKSWKDALASTIGWYNSRNSAAHITLLEFEVPEWRLKVVMAYLERFCRSVHPFSVKFDCIGTLGSALRFMPSIRSKELLSAVMKACSGRFPFRCFASGRPHITIGRRLAKAQLGPGRERFSSGQPALAFEVDGLYLRRFNESRGQYDVIGKFEFGDEAAAAKITVQETLFD